MTDKCGTTAGYSDHYEKDTKPCRPCKDAHAARQDRYRKDVYLSRGPLTVDSTGTRRRLQALVAMGWPFEVLGPRLGRSAGAVRQWTYNDKVRRDTVQKVAALYDELWNVPGPSDRVRVYAKRQGWAVPLAYDDDRIDDPTYRPSIMVAGRPPRSFDEIAVERACRGDRVHLRPVERKEAVARLTRLGLSAAEIALRLDVTDRAVTRHRSSAA